MPSIGARIAILMLSGLAPAAGVLAGQTVSSAQAADRSMCRYFSQLPDDCAGAEQRKFAALRGYRYLEVDLFALDALKKIPYVSIYDTTGQNGGDDTRNSAPEPLVDKLDPTRIAKEYHALRVAITPPLVWTIDWLVDRVGAARSFDGLDAAWMGNRQASASELAGRRPASAPAAPRRGAKAPAGKGVSKPEPEGYRPGTIARTTIKGFKKGSQVYLLDDPKGRTWVLVSYADKARPEMTLNKLDTLGDVLDLPEGWKFRAARISNELVLEPKGGSVGRMLDDKGDIYNLTGPGQSNFVP